MVTCWRAGGETVRRVADVLRSRRALLLKLELLLGSGLTQVCDDKTVWRLHAVEVGDSRIDAPLVKQKL